jgi:hypothetical protein
MVSVRVVEIHHRLPMVVVLEQIHHLDYSIDHDHVTGAVRGLLCNDCNMAFGYLHEDPERILDLLAYALKHQSVRKGDSS